MKRIYQVTYLCLLLSVFSCTQEEIRSSSPDLTESIPVDVKLNFGIPAATVVTRATSPEEDEYKVNNLYILIFNSDGSKATGQFFTYGDLSDQTEKPGARVTSGKISIHTTSGRDKKIYGIANITDDIGHTFTNSIMSLKVSDLNAIESLAELQNLTTELQQSVTARGTNFLMSGSTNSGTVNIPAQSTTIDLSSNPDYTIRLQRLDAKVSFKVTAIEGVTFIPKEWKVVKASRLSSVIANTTDAEPTNGTQGYFESGWNRFEGEGEDFGKTFSFYVLENRKSPRQNIPQEGDTAERYACREKQEKNSLPDGEDPEKPGHTVNNGDYVYADANSTYVVITGYIQYTYAEGQEVSANVVYTIHLGYQNNNPDDYNTPRNSHYIYNVTVESADKIILEVDSGNEEQAGAEGNVTIAEKIYNLDAHYETVCVNFFARQIDNTLTWYVSTPFSEGIPSGTFIPADFRWIKFRLNEKNGTGYKQTFATYPGTTTLCPEDIAYNELTPSSGLITVNQLVRILKENKEHLGKSNTLFDSGDKITFTAFIDENYYETDPTTGNSPVSLWKKFVNQPERIMNILSRTKYSPDGESVKTVAVASFRQKSIQTMYNVEADEGLQSAWGTEVVRETAKRPFWNARVSTSNSTPDYNSSSNGRKNSILLWDANHTAWNTYIDPATGNMKSDYNYARYTCMQRNRDNNGNGQIDPDEVRWYLAAINQLTDLWIGENSFDSEARLFKNTTWEEDFYVSSTVPERYRNSVLSYWDNPTILWSSEGSSIGNMNNATGYSNNMNFNYRCVRNLGVSSENEDAEPQDFASYNNNDGTINLQYLDSKSIRAYTQTAELPDHHERSADNLPFWKFKVRNDCHGNNLNWYELRNRINANNSPCPAGYRVPNQRELALMLSRIKNDGHWTLGNHFSRTRFSMNPNPQGTNGRPGFSVSDNAGILYLINNTGERGGVRCVRDLPK